MLTQKWLDTLYAEAKLAATRSKDPSTKVGCLIFDPVTRATFPSGYNGFPRGVGDGEHRLSDRPVKLLMTVHAEINALLTCAYHGISTHGKAAVVTFFPCSQCAGALVQAGICLVLAPEPDYNHERWGENFRIARAILDEGGVEVRFLNESGDDGGE